MCGIKGGESFFLLHILLLRLLDEGDKRSQHLAHPLSLYTYVPTHPPHSIVLYCAPADKAAGLLTTKITESPRKNILLTYRSLFIDWPFFRPFPPLENSVHISLTSSNSLHFVVWLKVFVFLQLIKVWVRFRVKIVDVGAVQKQRAAAGAIPNPHDAR